MQKIKLSKFSEKEIRWDFYPMFLKLIKDGFKIEAFLLMLSTWNFACFRYAVRSFNLDNFVKTIKNLEPLFKKFYKKDFETINFDEHTEDINKIFKKLSFIKGIQKTGAPKLMHLMAPRVFVMWDMYIRNYYGLRKGDADDYLAFLKLMQKQFSRAESCPGRTFAKLIDEHNYKTITIPALRKNKLKRLSKSKS